MRFQRTSSRANPVEIALRAADLVEITEIREKKNGRALSSAESCNQFMY
jgi:hypothetical protein